MTNPSPRQPLLVLYSHGRNPPLNPPPDLKYDLRNIPNPPKALRDVSDGRSKRLREHLLSEEKFVRRLEEVEREVLEAMRRKIEKFEGVGKEGGDVEGLKDLDDEGHGKDGEEEDEDVDDEDQDSESSIPKVVLRVGCNCALGHHRSVAFVTELSLLPWPKDWEVQIIHRDLDKKRSGGARGSHKAAARDKMRRRDDALHDGF
ncbi:hypothetical protein P154DRAFT_580224 [Amniculicola lignicola CBS 123094]|uniref:Uncharacterized protein n=1 Tax=Amniculicola lignicola CBS 123094 TaxID=1392246 RepID=A0A6A5W7Q6_9PLEO|nr:hypothetical protein P154DRAFT_580224 [Amniculicola lignicola CBS 123094]